MLGMARSAHVPTEAPAQRIVIVAFGTKGDIQPLCLLGRALQGSERTVEVVTIAEYADLVRSFGLSCTAIEAGFEQWLSDDAFDAMLHGFFTSAITRVAAIRRFSREIQAKILVV